MSRSRHAIWAFTSLLALAAAACGGAVVFEEQGGDGGTTPSGASGSGDGAGDAGTSGQGAGGSTAQSATNSAVTSTSATAATVTSSSGGPFDPCLGSACGAACVVCNDIECLEGACSEEGDCSPGAPTCETETLCYVPDLDRQCADLDAAPFRICHDCGGGKGCTFVGVIFSGPVLTQDGCCYEVTGGCAPNP